jgi:hypothetical protein
VGIGGGGTDGASNKGICSPFPSSSSASIISEIATIFYLPSGDTTKSDEECRIPQQRSDLSKGQYQRLPKKLNYFHCLSTLIIREIVILSCRSIRCLL